MKVNSPPLKPPAVSTQQPAKAGEPKTATPVSTGHAQASSFEPAPGAGAVTQPPPEPVPEWAKAPRKPFGEGKFENKTPEEIAAMGFDAIKSASPRELYAVNSRQLAGVEAALGGPGGKDYDQNFKSLDKDQRRAVLRAKIMSGVYTDMLNMMAKYSKIAG